MASRERVMNFETVALLGITAAGGSVVLLELKGGQVRVLEKSPARGFCTKRGCSAVWHLFSNNMRPRVAITSFSVKLLFRVRCGVSFASLVSTGAHIVNVEPKGKSQNCVVNRRQT